MASIAEAAHQGRPGGDQAAMQRLWPDLLLHDGAHLCAPPRARAAIGGVSDVSRTHHLSISSGQNPWRRVHYEINWVKQHQRVLRRLSPEILHGCMHGRPAGWLAVIPSHAWRTIAHKTLLPSLKI
jgi:hypothetical protein